MVVSFEGEALKEPALISLVSLPNRSLASSLEVVVLLLGGSKECWARKKGEERGGTEGKEGNVPPRLYACRSEKKKVGEVQGGEGEDRKGSIRRGRGIE